MSSFTIYHRDTALATCTRTIENIESLEISYFYVVNLIGLAAMYDKTESNIKVTKLRCCERFRKRFNSVLQTLLNN